MSGSPRLGAQANIQVPNIQERVVKCIPMSSIPKSVVPSKRSSEDDDIQFISSNPVKKQKISEHISHSTLQQHDVPAQPLAPMFPMVVPPIELRDSDRRISTGMVGLPSDINAMELASALRGVSLPMLENFVLNQPFRKPRPLSPPELSPKQLPQTIVPPMLGISTMDDGPGSFGLQTAPAVCMKADGAPAAGEALTPTTSDPSSIAGDLQVLNSPISQAKISSPGLTRSYKEGDPKGLGIPPPPTPRAKVPIAFKPTPGGNCRDTFGPGLTTHPCQVCAKMRQQAGFAKPQGLPILHHSMLHHLVPQIAYPPPYSQHLHPQMMPMGPNGMHPFSPSFSPIMTPVHGSNLAALPSHMPSPVQMNQQDNDESCQKQPEKPDNQAQPMSTPTVPATESATTPNPVKPPASLIQPTYRKPSPNLIVDVAETCQEKFPFEEVAKRHNVPVEKVFDVFAAIIQVPLLRCPTDRRRAGRLATTRVREYTRAKKAIQETGSQNNPGAKEEIVVKPLDVANHLGQVNFPDGFKLGGE
ncbi:hypothetical protein F4776DRAFT_24145 [Hypoxylon sp. NC0597]|nr:hypothetical protein F4776DRAFT_24145 [Hypoxylon sp. NC0597]